MRDYQREFVAFALARGVLRFGQYTLKSGRVSPYFFNAGLFDSGAALARLGRFYAAAITDAGLAFDMLYGPAYKGIPLVTATAIALAEHHGRDLPWCFDRKEAKDHGEGGRVVGAPLRGRVLIIDDVITAGTAVHAAMRLLADSGAEPVGVVIALDRQERGTASGSAIEEVAERYAIPVVSIVRLEHIVAWLREQPEPPASLADIEHYRQRYGI
ncbi:MAG: orotate phosphoribosyltransferase [Candidatus Competibacterales bacterium]|nr:orotate phosphoribosyltransferase [Candidatus Competibacterales bacterium]